MDINIILEPDVSPSQFAEIAVEAEKLGVRTIWSSNYYFQYDAFLALAPAAAATSKIRLGVLAVSPWEMHPLKMANATLTLNEMSGGRAIIAVSGGGGLLGALGWHAWDGAPVWPFHHPEKKTSDPDRRVAAVAETIEILKLARSGKFNMAFEGRIFDIRRPWGMVWAEQPGPEIYSCSSGPMMIRMGARVADSIQLSDFTVKQMPEVMKNVKIGFERREEPADDFRIGNFWAWHIKKDLDASMHEARRELIWRGAIIGQVRDEIAEFCHDEDELNLIMNNWENFRIAFRNRSGVIEGIPDDLINRLIAGMASAGDMSAIDREVDRYQQLAAAGLTELDLRLFDDPMDGLKLIGEHVLPAVQ
jgi:5,10-methylenetetrahydromethanopterin reductase